jgi:hypothetical protein
MFHIACDAPRHNAEHGYDLGDEWYSSEAVRVAREAGYHLRDDLAICPDCWDNGVRYADLSQ